MSSMSSALGIFLSRQEVLDVVWGRIAIIAVDITTGKESKSRGRILLANQPAELLFGYEMIGALRGKAVEELIPESMRARHESHVSGYARDPKHRAMGQRDMQLLGRKRDGTTFPIAIELVPAVIQDSPCVIALIVDMTGRIRPQEA